MKNNNYYPDEGFAVAILFIGSILLSLMMLGHSIVADIKHKSIEYKWYTTEGHYYDGYVIREDGHIWDYDSMFVEPDNPVVIKFCDNGTPDDVTDNNIISVVFDYTKTA